jgi:hypothetical protein
MKHALVALALIGLAASPARADSADYDPHSQSWQGFGAFVGLAEGMGFEVDAKVSLDWSEIAATDILVLVFPLQRIDPAKLGAFVHAGGHVLIADDFGEGKDALTSLGVLRSEGGSIRASRYQNDQLWAPIANARGDHPIANEVGDVVTNHPAVFSRADGATTVVAFEQGSVVVAGERGSGKFIAVSDPSVLINRMLQSFPGNVQLAANMLRWLDRGGKARRVVLVKGDFGMFGEPRPYIDDAKASEVGRNIAELNFWLSERRAWLLTPTAMKVLAAVLAILLLGLAMLALPVRRGPKIDGGWLKFSRPIRRDEPHGLIVSADKGGGSNLVLACILRDHVQVLLAGVTNRLEPLYTVPEPQLATDVARLGGAEAAVALARVYRKLRALPSRGQAAAPWSAGHLTRRDFDALYKEVAELCRTLGAELPGDKSTVPPSQAPKTVPPRQAA